MPSPSTRYAADPLARLMRRETTAANDAEAEIRKAQRAIKRDILALTRELDVGGSADARETVIEAVQRRIARLGKRLTRVENAALEYAARAAVADGSQKAGVEVRYSKERADEMIGILAGDRGKNLAAVFTENMAANVIDALRTATVAALRENAVAGGSKKELARALEEKWLGAARDGETFQFVDSGGHVWDTKTYVAMNVRTNAMRVYNDSLADTIGRATGSELVRVSSGGDPDCRLCFPWEGRILSLTGKTEGFPSYEEARETGLFHPNCVHTLEAVDELLDEEEIALQKAHPIDAAEATPEELDENRYEIDQDRYRRQGMDEEQARLAVDRDNLEASIRAGLLREDARQIVDSMTDAQVTALCPNGNPPSFEPTKKATRDDPHAADEKWRHGSRGGTVHIDRHADLAHILDVCGVRNADDAAASAAQAEQEAARRAAEERASLLHHIDATVPDGYRDTLAGAFDSAPVEVLRAVVAAESSTTCDLARNKAHCEYGGTSVHLSRIRGWGNSPATLAHEKGHAVLNSQGQKSGEAVQDRYKGIATAAQTEVATWAKGVYGKKWKSECRPSKKLWYTEVGEKVFGFTPEEMNSSLEKKKAASAVSDIFCAATQGRQFFGHSRAYYRSGEARPTHEIVANVTSLLCGPYAEKARAVIPQTMQAVETAVYGIAQKSKDSADTSRTKSS